MVFVTDWITVLKMNVTHRGHSSDKCSSGMTLLVWRWSSPLNNAQATINPIAASEMILTAYRFKKGMMASMSRAYRSEKMSVN